MVERRHPTLSVVRQCALLGISRSSVYYRPVEVSQGDLEFMRMMDRQYLATPLYQLRLITPQDAQRDPGWPCRSSPNR